MSGEAQAVPAPEGPLLGEAPLFPGGGALSIRRRSWRRGGARIQRRHCSVAVVVGQAPPGGAPLIAATTRVLDPPDLDLTVLEEFGPGLPPGVVMPSRQQRLGALECPRGSGHGC